MHCANWYITINLVNGPIELKYVANHIAAVGAVLNLRQLHIHTCINMSILAVWQFCMLSHASCCIANPLHVMMVHAL
jgi:hypothetical protein